MRLYTQLTPFEREKIMPLYDSGKGISEIARRLGRHKSTISRELKRNTFSGLYSSLTQGTYYARRKVCHPGGSSANKETLKRVRQLFYFKQRSPEQMAARLKKEKAPVSVS